MEKIDLLIVEDNPGDALLIQEYLTDHSISQYNFTITENLTDAIETLMNNDFNAIILDLNLPDSTGLETLQRFTSLNNNAAVIVMTGLDDEQIGVEAVKNGAQNYLVKNKVTSEFLQRTIRFSITQKHNQNVLDHLYKVLSGIRSINQLITREDNLKRLISKACEIIVEKSGSYHAWIILTDSYNQVTEIAYSGLGNDAIEHIKSLKKSYNLPCIRETLIRKKSCNFNKNANGICDECPLNHYCKDKSIHITQVNHKSNKYGFMGVAYPKEFTDDDKETGLFYELADDIAFALYNIQIQNNENRLFREIELNEKKLKERNVQILSQIEKYQQLNSRLNQKNAELIKAKEKAEESERLKSAFLANMSHEIRTPMNGILGFTNLLLKPDLTGDEKHKFIEIIRKSGLRMLNTVNDLIDISRIETGQVEVVVSEFDICKEIENQHQFFKPEAEKKGLVFELDMSINEDDRNIKTDLQKLNSILCNLIKNSIKYTDNGIIKVSAKVENNKLRCCVKDTGIGIPKNRQSAIFDRFVQADIADTHALEGSGLGLAISKAYCELIDGKLWLVSEEGKGSEFCFEIPINKVNAFKSVEHSTHEDNYEISSGNNFKVIIAEDDEYSYQHLVILFDDTDCEIIRAKNGIEAIDLCRENPDVNLVLMDIKMPQLNGLKATKRIREFNKSVIIIAQTAYALAGDKQTSIEAGCNDYISKPIDNLKLANLISKWIN